MFTSPGNDVQLILLNVTRGVREVEETKRGYALGEAPVFWRISFTMVIASAAVVPWRSTVPSVDNVLSVI